jgi:adenylate cyclase class IV
MARNIEIKARVDNLAALRVDVEKLAEKTDHLGPVEIDQDDTFFNCPSGRLKLRAFPDGTGQLI